MARRPLLEIVRYLRQLANAGCPSGADDAELLERYVRGRDEAAFELLVWRHGVMVLNVCRRILRNEQDIEDAFQATFLALVRKAPAIVNRGSIASWLYKVAYRIALQAKARSQKRTVREQPGGELLAVQTAADPAGNELRSILDEEVNRLPERLRRPFVLCYLEGKTNEEAARQLRCPPGTVYSRLARGREMLRTRLLRRGVTLSAAALTTALSEQAVEAVPIAPLVSATLRTVLHSAANGAISAQVTSLTEGVLRAMLLHKIKIIAVVLIALGILATGGVLTRQALQAESKEAASSVVQPRGDGAERTASVIGRVRASAKQQVYTAVSGYLKAQNVDLGSRVKKGDVLAEIDASLVTLEVDQAEAAVEMAHIKVKEAKVGIDTAKAELEAFRARIAGLNAKMKSDQAYLKFRDKQRKRYQDLLASGSIEPRLVEEQEGNYEGAAQAFAASQEALNTARAEVKIKENKIRGAETALESTTIQLRMAESARKRAEIQYRLTRIVASFDGVVTQRNFDVGDYIAAGGHAGGRPLLIVQRTDSLRIAAEVPARDVPFISDRTAVDLRTDDLPDFKLSAKVSRTGVALDETKGTMPIEIDVPNPKGLLRPGMAVTITLHLTKDKP